MDSQNSRRVLRTLRASTGSGKMPQRVKVPTAKPEDLNSFSSTYRVER